MNILQINSIDSRGGAAKLAERLGRQLENTGYSVQNLVGHKADPASAASEITYPQQSLATNRHYKLHGAFLPTIEAIRNLDYFASADIIHAHNLHLEPDGYFNIRHLKKLAKIKPLIWTLHDPWLIYDHYKTPQYAPFFEGIPGWYQRLKHRAVSSAPVTIVTPSHWLAELVRECFPDKRVEIIPNGVDTNIFIPLDRREARKKLGFGSDQKIILFVANGGEGNEPKGSRYLDAARHKLGTKNFKFVSLGSVDQKKYIGSEAELALYYNAADVFVLPSLAENLPLTILEAMACGTPAVSFDTGGVKEVINHKKNGYVAKYKDGADLIRGINLVTQAGESMRQRAIVAAKANFSLELMTSRYIDLYSSII